MFAEQRQSIILDILDKDGSVGLVYLVNQLGVSEATIRRDFNDLEKRGYLKRTHGGAVSVVGFLNEEKYKDESMKNSELKESIGRMVASMVEENDSIFLDSGTTTEKISMALQSKKITIITNSSAIPPEIDNYLPEVFKIGGIYRKNTKSIVGEVAEQMVLNLHPDKAFVAANGINKKSISTSHFHEGTIKKAIIKSSKKKYLVVDSTKFGLDFLIEFSLVSDFDGIITDYNVKENVVKYYQNINIPIYYEKLDEVK